MLITGLGMMAGTSLIFIILVVFFICVAVFMAKPRKDDNDTGKDYESKEETNSKETDEKISELEKELKEMKEENSRLHEDLQKAIDALTGQYKTD